MAFVPERIDEKRITELAEKITDAYMIGKAISSIEEYINTYMDVYDASKEIIAKREQEKINARNNISVEQLMNEAAMEETYDTAYTNASGILR